MKKIKKTKVRITWGFSPVTRTVQSKKFYKRQDNRLEIIKNS